MKRSGFKRPKIERKPAPAYTLARPCASPRVDETARARPKVEPVRSEAYRRAVASLSCIRCGIAGHSQAAHPNTGKGAGTKADDRLCFPLCADRPGVRGCHSLFDQGALYTRDQRRALEPEWARATIGAVISRGLWPAGLAPHAFGA